MINHHPLISVVIPIYNVEQYIGECLESLHRQDYPFLEFLLIDDGSTDGSASICKKYMELDNRFCYHYKDNSGQSGARNFALNIFKGDYVAFVDSDDKIAPNSFTILASRVTGKEYDIVQFSYYWGIEEDSPSHVFKEEVFNSKESLKFFLLYGPDVVWNKLVSRSIINKCHFKEGIMKEDSYVLPSYFLNANKVLNISDCLYYYRIRQGSVMNRPFSKVFYDTMTVYEQIMRVSEFDNELYSLAAARSVVAMANLYSQFCKDRNFTNEDKIIVRFKGREYLKQYRRLKKYSRIKFSYKIQIFLFSISPWLCASVLRKIERLS